MAEKLDEKVLVPSKIKVRWPITIFTAQGTIEAESRLVTDAGIFIHCDNQLRHNETYRIAIRPNPELSLRVTGEFILSSLGRVSYRGAFPSAGLSFVKIPKEDRQLLNDLVSINPEAKKEEKRVEVVREVKMTLHLETDQRTVEKDFSNLFDLRMFMQNFFSLPDVADRRAGQAVLRYTGPERRMGI